MRLSVVRKSKLIGRSDYPVGNAQKKIFDFDANTLGQVKPLHQI